MSSTRPITSDIGQAYLAGYPDLRFSRVDLPPESTPTTTFVYEPRSGQYFPIPGRLTAGSITLYCPDSKQNRKDLEKIVSERFETKDGETSSKIFYLTMEKYDEPLKFMCYIDEVQSMAGYNRTTRDVTVSELYLRLTPIVDDNPKGKGVIR